MKNKMLFSRKQRVDKQEKKPQEISDKEQEKRSESQETFLIERKIVKRAKKPNRFSLFARNHGKAQLEISSKNGAKILCAISKICLVENVENNQSGVRFCVKSKHLGKIIALLDNLCYDYKIIKIGGLAPMTIAALARAGLILGIFASVAMVALYTSFVTRVSVRYIGDDGVKNQVQAIINDMGATEKTPLKDIDIAQLEKALLNLDGISFASVQRNGTHIDVVVKSALPDESFVEIKGSKVLAQKRAVVTRVVCEGGTAVKKYGDVVNVGDVIIDGYIEYGDSKIDCQARGYAYGKVYYQSATFFADSKIVKTYGREEVQTRLSLFGKTPKTPDCPFEKCEIELSISDFGFLAPMKIYTYTFKEILTQEVQNTLTQEDMKRSAYSSLLTKLSESASIQDVYYDLKRVDGGVTVSVTIEAEELIA